MAHSQTNASLLIEIQILKEELDSSKKTVDEYAHLIAKLSVELENLRRSGICQACKKKLVSGGSPGSLLSTFIPLFRHVFQGQKSQHRSRSPVSITPARSSSDRPFVPEPTTIATIGGSDEQTTSQPNSEFHEWPVIHNPKVKKALDLHVARVFTYGDSVSCVNMSPDGERVAIGLYNEGKTYINEVRTGSNICVLVDYYIKASMDISKVQFSPDGQLVATLASDYNIRVWGIAQRRMRAVFRGHAYRMNSITFSPDGHYLVSGSFDYSAFIWNTRDGSSKELTDNAGLFLDVAFSPDGRYIAAGNFDHSLRIFDARTAKLLARWQGHTSRVWCVKFTPDGKGLMSGSEDKTLKYWDASPLGIHQARSRKGVAVPGQSLQEIRSFEGHNGLVASIAFFPRNTRWVLTSSGDGSVRVWDMESDIWQLRMQGHVIYPPGIDVSQTGTFLATTGGNRVALWKYKLRV